MLSSQRLATIFRQKSIMIVVLWGDYLETLRDNPDKKFTARELAAEFIKRYPIEMAEKQTNPRYDT